MSSRTRKGSPIPTSPGPLYSTPSPAKFAFLHAVVLHMKMAVVLVGRRLMDLFAIARAALAAHVIAHPLTIVPMGTVAFPS